MSNRINLRSYFSRREIWLVVKNENMHSLNVPSKTFEAN